MAIQDLIAGTIEVFDRISSAKGMMTKNEEYMCAVVARPAFRAVKISRKVSD